MASSRACKKCFKKTIIYDESNNPVCESCGIVQDFDNFQHSFGGISGPQGTFVSLSEYNYRDNKLYHAQKAIEDITSKLGFSSTRSTDVKQMIEKITEGEFGVGSWFIVLVGACSYVVMRMKNQPLSIAEVASVIGYDIHELGRMITRVVDFLDLELPEFNIVASFECAIRSIPSFVGVSEEKVDRMITQGKFLLQCAVKWFLTTGRRPLPVVAAVLVFVAELNQVEIRIEDVAKEIHATVITSRQRHKELQETLVKVARALPWGKDVTIKNILKNAPFVIQYMEMKSRLKSNEKRNNSEPVAFDLKYLIGRCLRKEKEEYEYGSDSYNTEINLLKKSNAENNLQDYEAEDINETPTPSLDDLEKLKLSQECLSRIYSKFSNDSSYGNMPMGESEKNHKRKRKRGFGIQASKEWWTGESDLSKKLSLKQILEKNVGFNALPPSFVTGSLACKRRNEKISAAKLRIKEIMQPPKTDLDHKEDICFSEHLQVKKARQQEMGRVNVDWEDCIIELLLLHQVKEDEIEQGHYNTLLDLYVFNH